MKKEQPPQEQNVIVDPELLREAGMAVETPASSPDLGKKLIEGWKMADELFSDMELAASVIDESDDQYPVADARHDAASKIKGVFSRAAQQADPMKQRSQIEAELTGLKMRFATGEENPDIAAAKMEVLKDFKEKLDAVLGG